MDFTLLDDLAPATEDLQNEAPVDNATLSVDDMYFLMCMDSELNALEENLATYNKVTIVRTELYALKEAIATYGLSAPMLKLADPSGSLSKYIASASNVDLPAVESLDNIPVVGSASELYLSGLKTACEAADGKLAKVWKWIKEQFFKLFDFITRASKVLPKKLEALKKDIGRVTLDEEKFKELKCKCPTKEQYAELESLASGLEGLFHIMQEFLTSQGTTELRKFREESKKLVADTAHITASLKDATMAENNITVTSDVIAVIDNTLACYKSLKKMAELKSTANTLLNKVLKDGETEEELVAATKEMHEVAKESLGLLTKLTSGANRYAKHALILGNTALKAKK